MSMLLSVDQWISQIRVLQDIVEPTLELAA